VPQPDADSDPVSNKDDSPPSSTDGDSRPKNPYGRERLILGISLVSVIVLFSLTGTIQVYRATLGAPATPTRFRTCEDGVRSLYTGFARKLSALELESESITPRRPITDPSARSDLRSLDDALRALEPLCASEGPQGREAWARARAMAASHRGQRPACPAKCHPGRRARVAISLSRAPLSGAPITSTSERKSLKRP
jgi:hypothetical protein